MASPEHGTIHTYWMGCRCVPCRGANADYARIQTGARKRRPKWRPKTEAEQIAEHEWRVAWGKEMRKRTRQGQRKFRYEEILNLIRTDENHIGQLARIAIFNKGAKFENERMGKTHSYVLRRHLDRLRPMEHWEVHHRLVPDTWGDYQLLVAYHGVFPSERQRRLAREARFAKSPQGRIKAKKRAAK